jgi:adenosylmethionine-8-amino-7-oxononanoate aminotransferase
MAVADGSSLPIAVSLASASPHEVTLVEQTLEARFVEEKPKRLIGDRAYDSDPLDAKLGLQSIEMIARTEGDARSRSRGRAQAETLQKALEGGTLVRLARELQTSGCPLRE